MVVQGLFCGTLLQLSMFVVFFFDFLYFSWSQPKDSCSSFLLLLLQLLVTSLLFPHVFLQLLQSHAGDSAGLGAPVSGDLPQVGGWQREGRRPDHGGGLQGEERGGAALSRPS